MANIKILSKESNCYKSRIINLINFVSMECTYPKDLFDEAHLKTDETLISQDGQKVEFIFEHTPNIEIDLGEIPTQFIVYDDYGNEIEDTDSLIDLENAIILATSTISEEITATP